jgi:tRNA nucleotidyltransferase (CCA-adding enzyme)
MTYSLPKEILDHIHIVENAGYDIYLVGGSVRNILLDKEVKDWDFTTSATPDQILALFPDGFYDNTFGTVGVPIPLGEHKTVLEITTFRTESAYSDNRHPESVSWGTSIEEDLSRRDFTVNAIAAKVENDQLTLIDPYGGQEDIKQNTIRAVGTADQRFKEDALRLMRAIRFASQLAFLIEKETWQAISDNSSLLQNISKERIHDELVKILASENPFLGIMLLTYTGLIKYIVPELLEGMGVSQERPGRHHTTDVFTHNVDSLKYCPSTNPIVRFAALIHDIAKPRVAGTDEEGYVIFHNHEIVGAKMAIEICDRLRFSKKDKEKIVTLIRWHMFTVDEHITDGAIRRFIRKVGVENVTDMIDVRIGDRLGSGTQTAESWRLKLFKKRIEEQLAPAPFSIKDLAIDGNDIMKMLKVKPGREIGELLQKLFEEVDEDLSKNSKEYLVKRVTEIAKTIT